MSQTNILLESRMNELEIVEFYIDEKDDESGQNIRNYYGINVAKVLEIIRMPAITKLPNMRSRSILGTFNLRNRIIPLIDISAWINKKLVVDKNTKVIVSEFNGLTNAFLVSGVTSIHRLSWSNVEPPSTYLAGFSESSVTGVVKLDDRMILILDLEKLVSELNPSLALRLDERTIAAINQGKHPGIAYRALIVDDSNSIRHLMVDLLRKASFEIMEAENGQEAWQLLQSFSEKAASGGRPLKDYVSLVVSDIEMPSMDGHTLTKKIKTDPVLRTVPVILFSSLITDSLKQKGDAVGADGHISKPDLNRLAELAKELIERNAAEVAPEGGQ